MVSEIGSVTTKLQTSTLHYCAKFGRYQSNGLTLHIRSQNFEPIEIRISLYEVCLKYTQVISVSYLFALMPTVSLPIFSCTKQSVRKDEITDGRMDGWIMVVQPENIMVDFASF